MESRKRLAPLIDADGCIYNPIHAYLVYYLIAKYGVIISNWATAESDDEDNNNAIQKGLNSIIQEIKTIVEYYEDENYIELCHINGYRVDDANREISAFINRIIVNRGFDPARLRDENIKAILHLSANKFYTNLKKLGALGQSVLNTILFTANKPFFSEIVSRVQQEKFDCVDLFSGSNRQSEALDFKNKDDNDTESFFIDLGIICDEFNVLFSKNICQHHGFVLADVYGDLEPGESHKKILKQRALDEENNSENTSDSESEIEHAAYVFDKTKFTLLYGMPHYIAGSFPHDKFVIPFTEDREDIHKILSSIFIKHPDLIPRNVVLEFWLYYGNFPFNYRTKTQELSFIEDGTVLRIQGTGDIDFNVFENIKKIAMMCGHNLKDYYTSINAAEVLDIDQFKRERVLSKAASLVPSALPLSSSIYSGVSTLFNKEVAASPLQELDIKEKVTLGYS